MGKIYMNIIKRKKGKGTYYYLKHSFRNKGRMINKERYLGLEIPKDIDKIKSEFLQEIKKDLNTKLILIRKNFQEEWKRIPLSAKEKELQEIAIAFTYNTNALEGSTITLEETREIIQSNISPNKSLRDVRETEAHSKTFLKMLASKDKLDEKLLLSWHKEIFNETKQDIAGKYRDYLVRVGSHLAPDWQDVEDLMKNFFKFLDNLDNLNPVELAARVHYKFEKIHPFGDGNGRIGRLLMNYLLWKSGYPMILIEYKNRKSYYSAFNKDEEKFVSYLIRRYLAVHKKRYLKRSGIF